MVSAGDRCGSFHPVVVAQWDVLNRFPTELLDEYTNQPGTAVHLLIRLGTEPLGYADFEFDGGDSLSVNAAKTVSQSFLPVINDRLIGSHLSPVRDIPANGLQLNPIDLTFVAEREQLLQDPPNISVVIATRDRPAHIANCLRRLDLQRYPSYEIVVVDNSPADPTAVPMAIKTLNLRAPVRYLLEPRAGLSWARNAGWRATRADIIAFLDDDAIPDEYWLAEILRGFSARPRVGCVTGMVLPAELKTEPQQWFEELGGFSHGRGFERDIFEPGHPQSPLYPIPPFGAGTNMAFRRRVLNDIDGFNVSLGAGTPSMSGEETFAFTQTLLAEHTIVYQPTALVFHYHRATLEELKKQLYGYSVGTAAFYAALISSDVRHLFALLRMTPSAIKDNWRANIEAWRTKDSPRAVMRAWPGLARTQTQGLLAGIPAYIRSVRKQRRLA
ncbi:glycosyltransferase family 2 protein [Mycobacterium sp. 852014-52450_SCH5900713]|uniref:glycosyltransferase n=1 Tax=Mycobacterium sp. 852014-52450_SCH5900713 TaxID=1834116 RepID=UPI0009EE0F31|nr:glycosyltransferase family 2 protein [Mycobacterium sp. 852014-52450_SCH5900713]